MTMMLVNWELHLAKDVLYCSLMEPPLGKEGPFRITGDCWGLPWCWGSKAWPPGWVTEMWGCAGEDKEDLAQPKSPPVGLLLAVTRMMNIHHRLYCLEADGKMEFGVWDVLLLSAHVEGKEKSGNRPIKKWNVHTREGGRRPTVSRPLGALCVAQNASVVCSGIPGWGLYRHLPSVSHWLWAGKPGTCVTWLWCWQTLQVPTAVQPCFEEASRYIFTPIVAGLASQRNWQRWEQGTEILRNPGVSLIVSRAWELMKCRQLLSMWSRLFPGEVRGQSLRWLRICNKCHRNEMNDLKFHSPSSLLFPSGFLVDMSVTLSLAVACAYANSKS